MKKAIISIILFSFFIVINGQGTLKISPPEVTFLDGILTIKYDIAGCATGDYVDIRLIILNSRGDTLRPTFVSGDLGSNVTCGFSKKIEWNMKRDGVLIDEEIDVQVTGKQIKKEILTYNLPPDRGISRGKVILSSIFVPGLGQLKASGKPGHLIFSGLVYGALGTAALYHFKSNKYYDDYILASGTSRDELFAKSEKAFSNSQYLLYAGAGAWAVNFIWSAAIPIRERNSKKLDVNLLTLPKGGYVVSANWTF